VFFSPSSLSCWRWAGTTLGGMMKRKNIEEQNWRFVNNRQKIHTNTMWKSQSDEEFNQISRRNKDRVTQKNHDWMHNLQSETRIMMKSIQEDGQRRMHNEKRLEQTSLDHNNLFRVGKGVWYRIRKPEKWMEKYYSHWWSICYSKYI